MKLRTLALIKPDLFSRKQATQKVLNGIEDIHGFRIAEIKQVKWTLEDAQRFYAAHEAKFFYDRLCTYMSSEPFLAIVLEEGCISKYEDIDCIKRWRKVLGNTSPVKARQIFPGTLRAEYGITDTRNSFHGSGSEEEAREEISMLFHK